MVKVTIYKDVDHVFSGFDVHGHAGLAESGTDIVCAAVSALVINTINAIEKFTDDKARVVSGGLKKGADISFRFKGKPGHDAVLLLDAMVLGLQSIEDNREYEPYIDIIIEEVC